MVAFSKPVRAAFKAASPRGTVIEGKGTFYRLPKDPQVGFVLEGRLAYSLEVRKWDDGSASVSVSFNPTAPLTELRTEYRKAASHVRKQLGDDGAINDRTFGESLVRFSLKCDGEGRLLGADKDAKFVGVHGEPLSRDAFGAGDTVRAFIVCYGAYGHVDKSGVAQFKLCLRVATLTKLRDALDDVELSDSSSEEEEEEMKTPAAKKMKAEALDAPVKKAKKAKKSA